MRGAESYCLRLERRREECRRRFKLCATTAHHTSPTVNRGTTTTTAATGGSRHCLVLECAAPLLVPLVPQLVPLLVPLVPCPLLLSSVGTRCTGAQVPPTPPSGIFEDSARHMWKACSWCRRICKWFKYISCHQFKHNCMFFALQGFLNLQLFWRQIPACTLNMQLQMPHRYAKRLSSNRRVLNKYHLVHILSL